MYTKVYKGFQQNHKHPLFRPPNCLHMEVGRSWLTSKSMPIVKVATFCLNIIGIKVHVHFIGGEPRELQETGDLLLCLLWQMWAFCRQTWSGADLDSKRCVAQSTEIWCWVQEEFHRVFSDALDAEFQFRKPFRWNSEPFPEILWGEFSHHTNFCGRISQSGQSSFGKGSCPHAEDCREIFIVDGHQLLWISKSLRPSWPPDLGHVRSTKVISSAASEVWGNLHGRALLESSFRPSFHNPRKAGSRIWRAWPSWSQRDLHAWARKSLGEQARLQADGWARQHHCHAALHQTCCSQAGWICSIRGTCGDCKDVHESILYLQGLGGHASLSPPVGQVGCLCILCSRPWSHGFTGVQQAELHLWPWLCGLWQGSKRLQREAPRHSVVGFWYPFPWGCLLPRFHP